MKYAVIRLKGQQFKVEEGDVVSVDYLNGEKPEAEVLMMKNEDKVVIGSPIVAKTPIAMSVIAEEEKGSKLRISKYKAKSRYRKTVGFRPKLSKIRIDKIG